MLIHGSLFSGIEGFGLGFERHGIRTLWASEIDPAACRVLRHHWPDLDLRGDISGIDPASLAPVDIITAGSPCQDVSVAGRRAGLAGARSGLFWEAIRVTAELRPALFVLENVPGLLSSNGGRDFGTVLDALAELGALDICWRILDAQYWGVAQRRRRVFVVADFRGRRAAEILALAESLSGHPAPRRAEREDLAGTLGGGAGSRGWAPDTDRMTFVAGCLTRNLGTGGPNEQGAASNHLVVTHALTAEGHDASEDGTGRGTPLVFEWQASAHQGMNPSELAPAMKTSQIPAVAFAENQRAEVLTSDVVRSMTNGGGKPGQGYPAVQAGMVVRRLTPVECCRLQGFPDDHLDINPPLADSAKYRLLGNAVNVAVTDWLGGRIAAALNETEAAR